MLDKKTRNNHIAPTKLLLSVAVAMRWDNTVSAPQQLASQVP
jgi:hypothetical protein